MSKILEVNKCPNCSGKLVRSEDGLRLVCPFCGSEFEPEDSNEEVKKEKETARVEETKEEKKEETKEEAAKEDKGKEAESTSDWGRDEWFEARVPSKKLAKGTNSKKVINCFVKCAELGSSEKILKYIRTDLKKGSGVGMPESNDAKLNAFVNRVKNNLDADETPLIYGNIALLSNGKKGILITDKRTLIGRSNVTFVLHENLDSISFDVRDDIPFIYFNGFEKNQMESIISADYDMMGALAALACAFAFERNPGREKIILTNWRDEE